MLAVGLLTNWPMVGIADAHANLLAASPAVGQPAGGTIDRVQLIFDEPISELVSSIEGPDGRDVSLTVTDVSPQQFELLFDPLEIEGIYKVRYEFVSLDTDRVELGHAFEYEVVAPEALPLSGPVLITQGGSSTRQWVVVGIIGGVVLALAERLRRQRRALARHTA